MVSSSSSSSSKCDICHETPWRYTCPGCSTHTCSLPCVRQHKQENGCTGERSKNHFVSMREYGESHMMSDYVYLEDMARQADTLARERSQPGASSGESKGAQRRAQQLKRQARFHNIQLDILPLGMSRRKMNQTHYNSGRRMLFWTFECYFCRPGDDPVRIVEHSILTTKTLRSFFENLLQADEPHGRGTYAMWRYQLRDFVKGMDGLVVGLKKEKCGSAQKTVINLTPHLDRPVSELLGGEHIIEFPTFYIWLEGDVDNAFVMEEKRVMDTKEETMEMATVKDDGTGSSDTSSESSSSEDSSSDDDESSEGEGSGEKEDLERGVKKELVLEDSIKEPEPEPGMDGKYGNTSMEEIIEQEQDKSVPME